MSLSISSSPSSVEHEQKIENTTALVMLVALFYGKEDVSTANTLLTQLHT